MDWRAGDNQVSTDDVSRDPRSQKYSIRVSKKGVVLNHVAGIAGRDETDAEVVPLLHDSIPTKPVPTEPVAAGAASQSYAAAGIAGISIAHDNVAVDVVVGSAGDENSGETIGGNSHASDRGAAAGEEPDAVPAELLN